ncbi:MAG: hypothetical protein K0V04_25785, partial [Deltaproteobacteria bacterium]|nr:hypothetical protein [Deltaproteobacteria bacterium]
MVGAAMAMAGWAPRLVLLGAMVQAPPLDEPAVAPAHPREYTLDWQAPPECPNEAQLRQQVEALLTAAPEGDGTAHVTGIVEAHEGGYVLTLTTEFRGARETRGLRAPVCRELGDATALLLATALEPML